MSHTIYKITAKVPGVAVGHAAPTDPLAGFMGGDWGGERKGWEGSEREGREGKLRVVNLRVEANNYHKKATCPETFS